MKCLAGLELRRRWRPPAGGQGRCLTVSALGSETARQRERSLERIPWLSPAEVADGRLAVPFVARLGDGTARQRDNTPLPPPIGRPEMSTRHPIRRRKAPTNRPAIEPPTTMARRVWDFMHDPSSPQGP